MDLEKLYQFLDRYFMLDAVRTLCFYVNVDYESLAGEGKSDKIRSLITYLNNRDRLGDLTKAIQELRPDLSLDELYTAAPPTSAPAPDLTALKERHGQALTKLGRDLRRGRLVFFVGADLAAELGGVPPRQTIADSLANAEGLPTGQRLASVTQLVMQAGNRFGFTSHLRDLLDDAPRQPQPFHTLLAGLVQENELETIITTSYANLLEAAFRQSGIGLNVVINDEDLGFANVNQPTLIKLYGDWRQPASLIVTEKDENELVRGRAINKRDMIDEVTRAFRRHTILFLGYDLADTAVSALFDEVTGGQFQQDAFAVWSGLSEPEIRSLKSNRNIEVIDADPLLVLQALLE